MPSTVSTAYQGTCTLSNCYGNRYEYVTLSSTWTEITLPFSSLKGGAVTPFQPATIWSFGFQFYSATTTSLRSFDLWVDDLTFYK